MVVWKSSTIEKKTQSKNWPSHDSKLIYVVSHIAMLHLRRTETCSPEVVFSLKEKDSLFTITPSHPHNIKYLFFMAQHLTYEICSYMFTISPPKKELWWNIHQVIPLLDPDHMCFFFATVAMANDCRALLARRKRQATPGKPQVPKRDLIPFV